MKNYALFILIVLIISTTSFAQVLPSGFIPMEHNGSFAGMADEGRLTLNMSQTLIKEKDTDYMTKGYGYYASYDNFIKRLSTGIGLTAYSYIYSNTHQGYGFFDRDTSLVDPYTFKQVYKRTYASLSIAPKISFKGKYTISPSLTATYGLGNYRRTRDDESIYNEEFQSVNLNAGIALNTSKYYVGYAVRLFKKYEFNIDSENGEMGSSIPAYYSVLEGGYSFYRSEDSKFSVTPQIACYIVPGYNKGSYRPQVDINIRFQYARLLFGQSHNNFLNSHILNTRSLVYVGWQQESFRIILMFAGFTDMDLSLRFMIPSRDKKRRPIFW